MTFCPSTTGLTSGDGDAETPLLIHNSYWDGKKPFAETRGALAVIEHHASRETCSGCFPELAESTEVSFGDGCG